VRRSYPAGLVDAILKLIGREPIRCRRCSHRFYRRLRPTDVLGLPDPPLYPVESIPEPTVPPEAVLDSKPGRTRDSAQG